jgi:hypothetical protein
MANELNSGRVERALRSLISDLDYDIHKSLESDEETGLDSYPDLTAEFISFYTNDEEEN